MSKLNYINCQLILALIKEQFDLNLIGGTRNPRSPLSKIVRSTHSMRASAGVSLSLSAMVRPRPGGTAFMITVTPTPSKFIN